MKNSHKKVIKKLISNYSIQEKRVYPLSADSFSDNDLIEGIKVILSKRLTMSNITKKFETEFAKKIGSKHALMVNSGSSANLLALFALINPLSNYKIKKGDECLIPALCWSTSLWPIVQAGLKPKFVDVNKVELAISKSIHCNFIIMGDGFDSNILVIESDYPVCNNEEYLKNVNVHLDKHMHITKVISIPLHIFSNFYTPKLSIKRKKLQEFVLKNYIS